MNTLHLVLKAKWYELIEQGDKLEEYREIKPYWEKRLGVLYDQIIFHYGYTNRKMVFQCEGVTIGEGKQEWGAAPQNAIFRHQDRETAWMIRIFDCHSNNVQILKKSTPSAVCTQKGAQA